MSGLKLETSHAGRYSQHGGSLTEQLGVSWKRTPKGMSQVLYNKVAGIPAKTKKLFFDLKRFGAKELAWSIHRDNESVLRDGPHEAVTPLRLADHEAVDSHEDIARAKYAVTRDPVHRAVWKKAVLREIADKIELYDALCAEEKGT